MMTVPVPMRTYGALVELSAIREMYGPSINFPHTPTASRMAPVIYRVVVVVEGGWREGCKRERAQETE